MDRLNQWLTLIANSAVLIGLIVLIVEIQQNTTAIENETYWNRVATAVEVTNPLVTDESFAEAFLEYSLDTEGRLTTPFITTGDSLGFRISLQLGSMSLQNEARFVTQFANVEQQRVQLRTTLLSPGIRDWYKSRLDTFTPEFSIFLQSIISDIEN